MHWKSVKMSAEKEKDVNEPINQLTNEPINQSTNQTTNQPTEKKHVANQIRLGILTEVYEAKFVPYVSRMLKILGANWLISQGVEECALGRK